MGFDMSELLVICHALVLYSERKEEHPTGKEMQTAAKRILQRLCALVDAVGRTREGSPTVLEETPRSHFGFGTRH